MYYKLKELTYHCRMNQQPRRLEILSTQEMAEREAATVEEDGEQKGFFYFHETL